MADTRIIKKYPNRRLYDTELSRYITLADLRALVLAGTAFQVVDANSQDDITRSVLLQIIAEQESGGKPLFTTDILTYIIRFYGATVQDVFTAYLQKSLELFDQQRRMAQDQMRGVIQGGPLGTMGEMAQRNLEMWREIQESFLRSAGLAPRPPARSEESQKDGDKS